MNYRELAKDSIARWSEELHDSLWFMLLGEDDSAPIVLVQDPEEKEYPYWDAVKEIVEGETDG